MLCKCSGNVLIGFIVLVRLFLFLFTVLTLTINFELEDRDLVFDMHALLVGPFLETTVLYCNVVDHMYLTTVFLYTTL